LLRDIAYDKGWCLILKGEKKLKKNGAGGCKTKRNKGRCHRNNKIGSEGKWGERGAFCDAYSELGWTVKKATA